MVRNVEHIGKIFLCLLTNILSDVTVPQFEDVGSNTTGMGGGFSSGGGGRVVDNHSPSN